MLKIKDALAELASEVKKEILNRMSSDIGKNKNGVNTLVNSSLYRSVDVYPRSDKTIIFQIADYFLYVVRGWERTKEGDGTFREYLLNIDQWIRRKGIQWKKKDKNGNLTNINMTQNEMVYALAKAMFDEERHYKIPPRPFIAYDPNNDTMPNYKVTLISEIEKILPFIDDFFDKWADDIFEKIMEETDKFFN